jgi:hypothetical protein
MDVYPPSCGANDVQFKSGDRIGGAEPVAASAGAVTVTPADVMDQVGHTARVCGLVASANYEPDTRAQPDISHPGQLRSAKREPSADRGDLR